MQNPSEPNISRSTWVLMFGIDYDVFFAATTEAHYNDSQLLPIGCCDPHYHQKQKAC